MANLATSVKTANDVESHGREPSLGAVETRPRKYHLSPIFRINPLPLSPLHGPSPFLPPAQKNLSEETANTANLKSLNVYYAVSCA